MKKSALFRATQYFLEICLNLSAIMITAAIKTLGDKKDSSRQAILKAVVANNNDAGLQVQLDAGS